MPTRNSTLLALFFVIGLLPFAYVWKTLYRYSDPRLSSAGGPIVIHSVLTHWASHGFFASYGMVANWIDEEVTYRWGTGAYLISSLIVEKIWMGLTGHYGWRLLAMHNALVALLTSCFVAVLCYRMARRLGAVPFHAFLLSVAAQMVHFTFPDNLTLYWEVSTQAFWFFPAIAFLLLEERACDGRTLRMTVLQSLAVFAMTYVEWIRGTFFLAAYFLALLLMGEERLQLKRIAAGLFLPWFVAIALYNIQLTGAQHESARTGARIIGSSFLYRTGLDGDAELYRTHLDIAFGRDLIRGNRSAHSQYLFHWPSLFFAGTLAVLALFLSYARGKVPSIIVIALTALTGTYVLFAAIFSQAVAMHPYQYDLLLATPLIVALFALMPAFIESHSGNRGAIVLITFLTAVWLSMFQLRLYAMANPLDSFTAKASHSPASSSNP